MSKALNGKKIHIGILCPPTAGHQNPVVALAKCLQAKGHRCSYIGTPDGAAIAKKGGLNYFPVGAKQFPLGSQPDFFNRALKMIPVSAVGFSVKFARTRNEILCREAPAVIKAEGIEALIVDQLEVAGGSIAEYCGIPFVTVCNALPVNSEVGIPPYFFNWNYSESFWSETLNEMAYRAVGRLMEPVYRGLNSTRRVWGLSPLAGPNQVDSNLAILSQMVKELDFPRRHLPDCFHYVGPLRENGEQEYPFPFEALDGQPLVFASLGTIVNSRKTVFWTIAEACRGLGVQLVVAHGGALSEREVRDLPGQPLAVPYAPQRRLIEQSSLVITHAGLNTVLDALGSGVPMVALPISGEQPGIAARVIYVGAGEVLVEPNVGSLRAAVERVLNDGTYRRKADIIGESIRASGGAALAADIVEAAFSKA